ncbi:MAG: hypothetical protein PHH37_02795 [Paludibacter sp.]|nr:hypothetical protein [Paludibacter sp.]
MTIKQNFNNNKKEGRITLTEKASATKQIVSILKEMKEKKGDVVRVIINNRTSIELPADLSQEERDERVANYIRLHKSKI